VILDQLARRYGRRPSELAHGNLADVVFDYRVAAAGVKYEEQRAKPKPKLR
jgi:hypothetical protein